MLSTSLTPPRFLGSLRPLLFLMTLCLGLLSSSLQAAVPFITGYTSPGTVAPGTSATFTVRATGSGTIVYRWQRLPARSASWLNLSNSATYTGTQTATLSISATTLAMNGDHFRCIVSNGRLNSTTPRIPLFVRVSAPPVTGAGSEARGAIPTGMPARLSVGLFGGVGDTWMRDSGVNWDMNYIYVVKGWRDNWGWDATNSGQYVKWFLDQCGTEGFMPVLQFYQIVGESPYQWDESKAYAKTQNKDTMRSYFEDFKVLLQRAKDYDKPVVILLEGDGFAYMEQQSGDNPNAPAAIASTGMPELQGLPNTIAGWGLAFLQLRKSVGADKVVLGVHVSGWATGYDLVVWSTDIPLQPEVDKAYAFLSKLGLASNVTGQTFDLLVGDPLDRDADFYRINNGANVWWDASESAPINTRSFNRYAEWLRLWNQKSGKRWVLWQIPLGNSSSKNIYNTGKPGEGYKDNRPEYFFLNGAAHREKFANAGVVALLFGAGADGQATYKTDLYSDGQYFMKSRAGAFLKAGGLPLVPGKP